MYAANMICWGFALLKQMDRMDRCVYFNNTFIIVTISIT